MSNTEVSTPTTDEYPLEDILRGMSVQRIPYEVPPEGTSDDDDLLTSPLTKLAAPTDKQLVSDKLTGKLENCHVRKAFIWPEHIRKTLLQQGRH